MSIERKMRRMLERANGAGPSGPPPLEAIPLLEFVAAYQAAQMLNLVEEQGVLREYIQRRVKELTQRIQEVQHAA
jgi:hypothetical protein